MPTDIDTTQKEINDPDEENQVEKDFSVIDGNRKAMSGSDSSYDMLLQRNDDNNLEDEDSLELFGHEKRALNYLINEYIYLFK